MLRSLCIKGSKVCYHNLQSRYFHGGCLGQVGNFTFACKLFLAMVVSKFLCRPMMLYRLMLALTNIRDNLQGVLILL